MTIITRFTSLSSRFLSYAHTKQAWERTLQMITSATSVRNQSSVTVSEMDNLTDKDKPKSKRTVDIVDQPRARFYGFTDWAMLKDYKKRMCVKDEYATRMRLNAIRKNTILPKELRDIAHQEVEQLPRNSNPIRVRNRCVMTSRPRGVVRKWRVSRIMWRHFAEYNLMSGVKRSQW